MKRRALLIDNRAAAGAEFALVVPLLVFFLFGIIDAGRYMWAINKAEKAAQMGVRMAVVTDYVASDVGDDYVGQCSPAVDAGEPIPAGCFSTITCNVSGGSPTCSTGGVDSSAFNRIVDRIRLFMPEIGAGNVDIIYSPSGLGYAGDPNGADLAPLVTVRLHNLAFRPIALLALANVGLPEVRSSLTFEDGTGAQSN